MSCARPLALALMALGLAGCAHTQYGMGTRVTGTCEGACSYYLSCKGPEANATYSACVRECYETFSDPYSLAEFERLDCEDAVAFVEGSSGRGPGGDGAGQPP